jgi:glycosyltransferase involved in cell wall biosynthesis
VELALKICFFNRSYWPDLGATGQLLTELAENLVRSYGCTVSVVAGPALSHPKGAQRRVGQWGPVQRERHNGVDIFRASGTTFRPRRFAGRAANYLSYFLSACYAGLQIPRTDIVIALTDPPIIGLAAFLAARRAGAKFIFLCQDIFPEVALLLEDFRNETVNCLLDRVNRLLISKADHIVALGETMRARLIAEKGADPHKLAVIHNWANCSAIVPGPKQNAFSRNHGLADKFVVMHSGNIGLSQGLETVVEAAAQLKDYPDIQVVFVGTGVKKPFLEDQVRTMGLHNVSFLPYQPREGLSDSFASADVFIVSLNRGLAGYIVPSKLYGILAAGRPYVAAVEERCEVATITQQYDCGLLAEPADPNDLAARILTLYHDRSLAQRLGANARQAALAFDCPLQVRAYYDLFQQLANASPSHP